MEYTHLTQDEFNNLIVMLTSSDRDTSKLAYEIINKSLTGNELSYFLRNSSFNEFVSYYRNQYLD